MQTNKESNVVLTKRERVSEHWIKQVTSTLAKKFKITVKKGKGWSADVNKGVMTYSKNIYELNHNQALGILSHEISHLLHTKHPEPNAISDKFPELTHQAVNMLEDHRIEYLMGEKFIGAREAIGMMHEATIEKYAKGLEESGNQLNQDLQISRDTCVDKGITPIDSVADLQRLRAISVKDIDSLTAEQQLQHEVVRLVHREDYIPVATQVLLASSMMHFGQFPNGFPNPEVCEMATKISARMKTHKIEKMKSTQEISDFFVNECFPIVQEYFTDKEENQQKSGNPSVSPATEQSEGMKQKYNAKSKTEEMNEKIEDMVEQATGKRPKLNKKNDRFGYLKFDWDRTKEEVQWEVGAMIDRLKKVLKDNAYDRHGGRFLSGKLNTRTLYKHRAGNMRLFQRKIVDNKKDFSFVLNVDVSLSMNEKSRMEHAQKATVMLTELLLQAGMKVGIVGFGEEVHVIKALEEKLDKVKTEKRLTDLERNTLTHEGLELSTKLLNKQGTGQLIVITITDGNVRHSTALEVQRLVAKNKHINYYGIGLGSRLSEMFEATHSFQLKDDDNLLEVMIAILKKHIKN